MLKGSKAKIKSARREILVAISVFVLAVLGLAYLNFSKGMKVEFSNIKYSIEIADDDEERRLGLSGREKLDDGRGMLFVYEESGVKSFWMKDMLIPIDIIWINSEGEVVHIEEGVSPDTYPETFVNDLPAQYVLEIPAGDTSKYAIGVGDTADINL